LEPCTIVVAVRDRFSTTEKCLETLLDRTPVSCDLLAVLGGMPERMRRRLKARFEPKVRFIFTDRLLNPAQSRNIGLRETKTRLAVLMDNDVNVRPGWLEPLLKCQLETGAAMVVPIVLEMPERIHTAANRLYVTTRNGRAFANKELCFAKHTYLDGCNLRRELTDYGELHCQLVVVETALKLGVYDEMLREVGECDAGLAWQKAGCSMWFEPASVVHFAFSYRITRAEDIRPFMFKWDMREILKSYHYFRRKWGLDITGLGSFSKFLVEHNGTLGLLPRLFPSRAAMAVDYVLYRVRRASRRVSPARLWEWVDHRMLGYHKWPNRSDHPFFRDDTNWNGPNKP